MKVFRNPPHARHQLSFLPPALNDLVPKDAPARRLSDTIDALDCSELLARYRGGGAPAYDPRMLLKILLQSYSEGIRSSRRIAERCTRDTHYLFLAEMSQPDHRTICRFRRDNEQAIKTLFCQTVVLCQEAGLVLLDHVAVDGTKLEANVSSKETYTPERVDKAIAYTKDCIDAILKEAEAQDSAEETTPRQSPAHGDDKNDPPASSSPPSSPAPVKDTAALVPKLTRRKARAEAAKAQMAESGRKTACATDLESRVMKTTAGNRPAYNAQAAVDGAHQVIVAALITQQNNDGQQMAAVLPEAIANTGGQKPKAATADCGYNTPGTLLYLAAAGIDGYIAEREDQKVKAEYVYDDQADVLRRPATESTPELLLSFHGKRTKDGATFRVYRDSAAKKEVWVGENPKQEMLLRNELHERMRSASGKAIYSQRQQTVEPVFGHLKTVLQLRRLLLRGVAGATIEYLLACAAHNFKKLARYAPRTTPFLLKTCEAA